MAVFKSNWHFKLWLSNAQKSRQTLRPMSTEELAVFSRLTELYYLFGSLMVEGFAIIHVLEAMQDERLMYVKSNVRRAVASIGRQRDLIYAARKAYTELKPDYDEMLEVRRFISECEKRAKFVEKVILPENLKLTPMFEYLGIKGHEIKDDLLEFFGTKRGICSATKAENDGIERYVNQILAVLDKHGARKLYEERINEYIRIEEERKRKRKAEKQEEDRQKINKLLRDEMDLFQIRFNRAICDLQDDPKYGISEIGIRKQIEKHGRDAYVILRCSYWRGKVGCSYVTRSGKYVRTFYGASVWKRLQEAEKERAWWEEKGDNAIYEVVKISEVEEIGDKEMAVS